PLKGREALHVTQAANAVGLLWDEISIFGSVKRGLAVPGRN
ncbi:rRNA (cytosine-C(5)-)-methyltransferase RsmF, partial [Salmonella enterica subsp. enterica serovar Heidelberg str. N4496]